MMLLPKHILDQLDYYILDMGRKLDYGLEMEDRVTLVFKQGLKKHWWQLFEKPAKREKIKIKRNKIYENGGGWLEENKDFLELRNQLRYWAMNDDGGPSDGGEPVPKPSIGTDGKVIRYDFKK